MACSAADHFLPPCLACSHSSPYISGPEEASSLPAGSPTPLCSVQTEGPSGKERESISPSCWEAPGSLARTLEIASPTRRYALWAPPLCPQTSFPGSLVECPSPEAFPHPYPEDQTSVFCGPGSSASALLPFGARRFL